MKPLITENPYPSVSDLQCDAAAARIISGAYATSCGELNAVLQYVYHSFNFYGKGDEKTAELLMSIAVAEMKHLDLLGRALIGLGTQPVYTSQPPFGFNYYSTKFVAYSGSLSNMIEDDVMAEKHAIYGYERMLCRLKNKKVAALIERILEDEKLHLSVLMKLLDDIC